MMNAVIARARSSPFDASCFIENSYLSKTQRFVAHPRQQCVLDNGTPDGWRVTHSPGHSDGPRPRLPSGAPVAADCSLHRLLEEVGETRVGFEVGTGAPGARVLGVAAGHRRSPCTVP